MATRTATAGVFQSRGEDFIHFIDANGRLMAHIDASGAVYTPMVQFPDGTKQTSAGVALPSTIDVGTF